MKFLLPAFLCFCHWHGAWAQGADAAYAAPGMPIRVQGKVQLTLLPKVPLVSPVLPRHWHRADSAQISAVQPMRQFIASHLRYLATTMNAGIGGRIYVHLTVLANGTVSQATITRRELTKEMARGYDGPEKLGKAALDQEVLRIAQALRFEPSTAAVDTVTIAQSFSIQQ